MLSQFWGQNGSTINGVRDLVRYGADVINFSWVSATYYSQMADIIEYALQQGRVCVASAGNDEDYYPFTLPGVRYPAAYNFGGLGQVIAVSATMMTNGVEDWVTNFNYCPGTDPINDPTNAFIDFSAPGTNYRALDWEHPYGTVHIWAGTSISAPFVSALVGLMLSVNSTLTPAQVYDIIKSTTDRIGSNPYSGIGWNRYLGYGRIDAANAVNVANGAPPKPRGVNVSTSPNLHPSITWESVPNAVSYRVEKYVTYEVGWLQIAQVTGTNYEDLTESICVPPPGQQCSSGHWVYYRVKAVNNQSKVSVPSLQAGIIVSGGMPDKISVEPPSNDMPTVYSLNQNYPNPFNPTTTISYLISKNRLVNLKVYDFLGKEVTELVNEAKEAGNYSITFNASELPSGIYFYTLTSGNFKSTKKLILLK